MLSCCGSFTPRHMLTQTEIETFQKIILQEYGKDISYETATEWASSFYELVLLIIAPPKEFYSRLSIDPQKTMLDKLF